MAQKSRFQKFFERSWIRFSYMILNPVVYKVTKIILSLLAFKTDSEPHVLRFLLSGKPGQLFIDVGGNVGRFTCFFACRGYKVITFEPDPRAFHQLVRNTRNFDNVRCHNLAVSNINSTKEFYLAPSSDQSSFDKKGQYSVIKVHCITLDSLGFNPDLMKIDVEGHEYYVLLGAVDTLMRARPKIVVEVHDEKTFLPVSKLLSNLGYAFRKVSGRHLLAYPKRNGVTKSLDDVRVLCNKII